jgi:dihydroneopterin aldolase
VSDRVSILGLSAHGRHGVGEAERASGQTFVVDLALHLDTRPAAESDALADTVDYAELASAVTAIVEGEPVNLIETLAARIADRCLTDPRVVGAEVTVHKPEAPIGLPFRDVTVTVDRRRI